MLDDGISAIIDRRYILRRLRVANEKAADFENKSALPCCCTWRRWKLEEFPNPLGPGHRQRVESETGFAGKTHWNAPLSMCRW